MADDVTFTAGANATPPDTTKAATDEITVAGPHLGAHAGIAKLAVSADGDGTHLPATLADGLLVNLGANNDVVVTGTVSVTEPVSVDDNGGSLTIDNSTLAVVGGGTEATALRVTVANDSTGLLSVDDNGGSLTVDAPLATPAHVRISDGTDANTVTAAGELNVLATAQPGVDIGDVTVNNGAGAAAVNIQDGGNSITVDGSVSISGTVDTELPAAAALADNTANPTVPAVGGFLMGFDGTNWDRVRADGGSLFIQDGGNSITIDNSTLAVVGGGTEAAALRVTLANDSTGLVSVDDNGGSLTVDGTVTANAGAGTFTTKETRSATAALTTVADNAASVTILASNAARIKAIITNDSSARLYLRFEAAAASTSNYGVSLAQHETWEEFNYTGEIRGIWATDPNDGAARVTEFT